MRPNQKLTKGGYELIGFPMTTMNVTQGNNGQLSHQGVNAIDIAGKDTGIEPTFAPCKMHFVWADTPANGNAVFFESDNKVLFADGTVDYAKFMFIHDNYINDIKQVRNFVQGQEFGDEGTAGYATGNHCHFEVAKGKLVWNKYSNYGYYGRNSRTKVWHLQDSISADKACVIDGTTIKNGNAMGWKTAAQVKAPGTASTAPSPSTTPQMYRVRKTWADTKSQIGAFGNLENAKKACKPGYTVFDQNGKAVYSNGGATSTKQWRQDVVLKIGDKVKSVSCAIAPYPGTNSAIKGDAVYVPALGGLVPLSDVEEAGDTKDGKADGYLANTNARVYLKECTVQKINVQSNLAYVSLGYWVKCGPLMAYR